MTGAADFRIGRRSHIDTDEEHSVLHAPGLKGFIIFLAVAGVVVPLFHRARIAAARDRLAKASTQAT